MMAALRFSLRPSTAGLISINAVLEEFEVPCIAYAIGAELVTHDEQGNTRPYMFRVNTTASQCTELIGRYSADVLGYRKAAIFYDITNSSGADGVTYFTERDLSRRVARSQR